MKRILSLLLVVLVISGFSACAKQEPKELQMLWWSDGTEGASHADIAYRIRNQNRRQNRISRNSLR
jgi:hypothetical protein